jgi:AraC-like DNA-binding protein
VSGHHREGEQALDAYQVRLLWMGAVAFTDRWLPDAAEPSTWRLSFRDEGQASLRYGAESIALPPRRPVLIAPEAARGAKPDGDAPHLLVEFHLSGVAENAVRALGSTPLPLHADELRDRLCARLLRDVSGAGRIGSATFARAKAAVHLAVAGAFELDAEPAGLGEDATERQLRPVLRYIDTHLDEPLDNSRLAALVHASESHFIRSFRRLIGSTPARHVQERRVQRAAELLAGTVLSIDEIAERCGFANRYHFSRVFAQRMAAPPGRYRASHGSRQGFLPG